MYSNGKDSNLTKKGLLIILVEIIIPLQGLIFLQTCILSVTLLRAVLSLNVITLCIPHFCTLKLYQISKQIKKDFFLIMGCLLSFSFVSHILPTPTVGAYRKMLNGYDNYYLKAHYGKICID